MKMKNKQVTPMSLSSIFLVAIIMLSANIERSNAFIIVGPGIGLARKRGTTLSTRKLQYEDSDKNISLDKEEDEVIRILGICGGIGSGKSQCCKILSSNPSLFPNVIRCIDSDKVAHSIYDDGNSEVLEKIRHSFGDDIIINECSEDDNNSKVLVDRKKLGQIVFSDENKMAELETIVWPHVKSKIESICNETIKQYQENENEQQEKIRSNPVIIIEGAVMIEAGWDSLFNAMWIISTDQKTQESRLTKKRGLSSTDAKSRIEFQQRNKEKKLGSEEMLLKNGVVNAVVENNGDDLEELVMALKKVWSDPNSWKKRA